MTTPVATPVPSAEPIPIEAPKRAGRHNRLVSTIGSVAVAIAITVFHFTHDGSKDAMKDFAKDLKDEPGITSIKKIAMPGYSGAFEVNSGTGLVRFKKSGTDVILSYEVQVAADAEQIDTAIQHAAQESGFKDKS
jgi:hypothetical protein